MKFHTNKKYMYIRGIVVTLSLFIFSSCIADYREHFIAEHSVPPLVSAEYHSVSEQDTVWILPDKTIKQNIIVSLQSAQKRIWLEIYMLTDSDIVSELIAAHERWVDVRIILEGNVYGLPYANTKVLNRFKAAWIPVVYADGYQFTFTHAKFWVIDERYYISTGNLTKSFFETNRDFVFSAGDANILWFLEELFSQDFDYKTLDKSHVPSDIVLSPVDARDKIESILQGAQSEILVYNQTLTDESILNILSQKQSEWVYIRICTADNQSNREYSGWSLPWAMMKKPYLHGKIILVDNEVMFIWSQNLTYNAIENNRELWILLEKDTNIFPTIIDAFERDCIFN